MPTDARYDPAFQRGYEEPPPPEPVRRRNPWLAVLWVLAGLFILGGVAVLVVVPSADSAFDVFVLPVLQAIAPWLVGAGLAALVAAVTLHAVRAEQQ